MLNNLHSSLCEEKREEHRRVFNLPLLINMLVGDGWKDGLYAPTADGDVDDDEKKEEESSKGDGTVFAAIRFVLNHCLKDMASFATREPAMDVGKDKNSKKKEGSAEDNDDKEEEESRNPPQRMSRAVASSLPPTLSLLRRLISRPLLVESQITSALTKMKEEDLAKLITNLPPPQNKDDDDASDTTKLSQPKLRFNATQFARALHLSLAKLCMSIWTHPSFALAPSHVLHPFIQLLGEIIRSLEEASRAVLPLPPPRRRGPSEREAGERGGSGGGSRTMNSLRDALLADRNSRNQRILASMGLVPAADGGGELGVGGEEEPFEPSEESISTLAEMGFSRDHALEALESVGSNRVEVAMEYALSHPPSSPGTLERRRAAREQRRQEQQRRREEAEAAQREASANQEETNPTGESSGDADGAPNQPAGSDKPQNNDKAEN